MSARRYKFILGRSAQKIADHFMHVCCHASHEACGLKYKGFLQQLAGIGHASHEACGLKSCYTIQKVDCFRHASHEACGLKYKNIWFNLLKPHSHASHEACGLKFPLCLGRSRWDKVTPRMRRVD